MRIRRTLPLVVAVLIVAAALTLVVQLRKHAPPEAARLLPGGDAFLYVDLSWVRKANSNGLPAVSHDPGYERFIQETGIQFERDLEAAAFSVHYPATWPSGGTGGSAPEPRFSEVFIGKFHGEKLAGYLRQVAKSVENYNSIDIFSIPLEDRMFRVAVLSVDAVAASNHDDPAVIRGIVDRSRRLASPFGGPALLRRYYRRVQIASPVWIIARVVPSAPAFNGWGVVFPQPADLVLSVSYNPLHLPIRPGTLHLTAEALTANPVDARTIADKVNVFLTMFHSAEEGSQGTDADVKAVFDSLHVHSDGERAVLNATVPSGFLHKMIEDSPAELTLPTSQPSEPAAPKKRRK